MSLAAFPRLFLARFGHLAGKRILVALSGGPDSVALLHLLRDPALALDLHAAHVHHQVRGADADADARFCERLCHELDVPFHIRRLTPPEHPAEGREAAWRRLRYAALDEIARAVGAEAVATGHQRDDVAEGVLVQLLRGAGPRALAGIAPEAPGGLIRPLLPWSRCEILAWLSEHGIPWREDVSNRSPEHLRNAVRHCVLPVLEETSPAVRRHLVHLAEALAADEDFLAAELRRRADWIDPWDPEGGVSLTRIARLHPALRVRWLHAQAARAGLGRVTRRQGELLAALLDGAGPRSVTLAGRWRLRAARGRLWLEPPAGPPPYSFEIAPGGSVALPLPGWEVRFRPPGAAPDPASRFSRAFPGDRALTVRSPRPGDRVPTPRGPIPLSRLSARRLPRHLRGSWPVICAGATITWVPGIWDSVQARNPGNALVEVVRR